MPSKQARNWCFTLNNYEENGEKRVLQGGAEDENVCYMVIGKEIGESGTPHLQGYVQFTKRIALGTVKRLVGTRAHCEVSRGTPKQAADYCKKDGDYQEIGGIRGGQGTRSDLAEVYQACRQGQTFSQIGETYPSAALRYGSGIQRIRQLSRPTREFAPTIWCFWGKTGSGKTRRVWEFSNGNALWVHPGERWFDGYDGQPAVLFDDFDGSWFKLSFLLRLLDRYPMPVAIKGGHTWWTPKTIYITSNIKPQEWYTQANDNHQAALMRRLREFGTIEECTGYPE